MSRFLLLNFEDFGLNQDIKKMIQPFNPFCICCLNREGPMFNLVKCEHSDYLDAFDIAQLKQFNQLVCLQCHNILKKIKCFQQQILESCRILLSGTFTNTTVNSKKLNSLLIQKVIDDLHLPPTKERISDNITDVIIPDNLMDDNYNEGIENCENIEEHFSDRINMSHSEDNLINEDGLNFGVNKNIKTALEILERNNQSFVTLGSQLQFLNGEHLSFLEPSLLSKEILTDIPLVPAKSLSTDLDNGLMNNSKNLEIEIDGPDKMFYDSLDLSPDLMGKESGTGMIEIEIEPHASLLRSLVDPKTVTSTIKPKKVQKPQKNKATVIHVRRVKLSQDELNRERVLQAQSDGYLRYKFRCETCIVGFNYKENLDDHNKRKHGLKNGESVTCDICSQLIPNSGSITEHNYRHYTRYDCLRCNKRYHTYDEAHTHSVKNQCLNGAANRTMETKQTPAQIRRAKLKMKQARNET